jgi:hypothetical protein
MRPEPKPLRGRVRFAAPISVEWYWRGEQIDGPGKVEWALFLATPAWLATSTYGGTRPCLRKNAQAVALRAASGRAEELGDRLLHACEAMEWMAEEVTP